jgi:hypothetical protein
MKLPKAKTYALEMVKGIRPGKVIADPSGRLHRLHVDANEPMPDKVLVWAVETADYPPLYSRPPAPPERSCVADYQLEYYPGGYPKLPECLDPAQNHLALNEKVVI